MVNTAYIPNQNTGSDVAIRMTIRYAETLIFFVLLLFFSGAVIGLLFTNLDNLEQENPIARLLWYPIYLFGSAHGAALISAGSAHGRIFAAYGDLRALVRHQHVLVDRSGDYDPPNHCAVDDNSGRNHAGRPL